jgi:hypothetical protein
MPGSPRGLAEVAEKLGHIVCAARAANSLNEIVLVASRGDRPTAHLNDATMEVSEPNPAHSATYPRENEASSKSVLARHTFAARRISRGGARPTSATCRSNVLLLMECLAHSPARSVLECEEMKGAMTAANSRWGKALIGSMIIFRSAAQAQPS